MKRPIFIFLLLLAALTGVRLWLASSEEWSADEAYLFLVSRHLDWAYFDGPSGLPALLGLSEWALGTSPLSLRLPGVVFSLLASLAAVWAGRAFYSWSVGFWTAIALNLLPLFNLASLETSVLLPILTFWLLLAGFTTRALHSSRFGDWLWAGICGAIGLLFSYAFVLAFFAIPLAAVTTPKARSAFRQTGIYVAGLVMLVGIVGPLFWNIRQDWISFSGQTLLLLHTFAGMASLNAIGQLAKMLAGLPLIALLGGLIWAAAIAAHHPRPRLILVFAGLPTLAVAYALFRGETGELFALPALAVTSFFLVNQLMPPADLRRTHPRLINGCVATICLVALGMSAIQLTTLARTQTEPPWGALEARLQRALTLNQPAGDRSIFFVAGDRDLAAGLGFYILTERNPIHDFPPIYLLESQNISNQFGLWPRYDEIIETPVAINAIYNEEKGTNPNLGRTALYIGYEPPKELPQTISAAFDHISALEKIEIKNSRPLYLYLCENYQMAPL